MQTTMDKAGRIVIPLALRHQIGLVPGPVEIVADGEAVRIEPVSAADLVEKDGRLVLPSRGMPSLSDDELRELRLADQR